MPDARDDFYVGYLPEAPPALGRWLRKTIALILLATLTTGGVLVSSMRPFGDGRFDFGVVEEYTGYLTAKPVPTLVFPWEQPEGEASAFDLYQRHHALLVAPFKFGADELISEHVGRAVRLKGTWIERDGTAMIEVLPGTIESLDEEIAAPAGELALGKFTFRGEIVDSKCYLGVMKPGNLKPHRACATNCIRGGVPPVLLVRSERGPVYYLLVDVDGSPVNDRILDLVAEPIEVTGEVVGYGLHQLALRADPATYKRL